jgi:YegS/Rv2252/BmrU family lipid kinase
MKSSIVIIYNPASRRASDEKIRAVSLFFERKGFLTKVLTTGKRGDAEEFARQSLSKNPYAIIAAGGDGTINEVVNGMAFSEIPLAIAPLGTTNVLAREIYRKNGLENILLTISSKAPRQVSLGKITSDNGQTQTSRYFCLMAGIGFDAQAVHDVKPALKKYTGPGAYILSGLSTLLHYAPPEIVVSIDGRDINGYAAIVGNISRYGGDFRITPDARIEEPALYACVFRGKKRVDLLRYVFAVSLGRHVNSRDVIYMKAAELSITGAAPVQVDGDYFGMSPIKISVARNALMLIY